MTIDLLAQQLTVWAMRQPGVTHSGLAERSREFTAGFLTAVENRDARELRLYVHRHNPVIVRAFAKLTGIKVGKADEACYEAIKQYIGEDAYHEQMATYESESRKYVDVKAEAQQC